MQFDVCVIGAGTVGTYVAGQLAAVGQRVVVIEAGVKIGDNMHQLVNSGNSATAHMGIRQAWTTGLGGSSQLWGGQLWPWQPWETSGDIHTGIDGWPLDFDEIARNYAPVRERLGLRDVHRQIHDFDALPQGFLESLGPELKIRYSSWMDVRERNFGTNRRLARDLSTAQVRLGVIANRLVLENGSAAVEVVTPSGMETILARNVVLAAGVLGTTRILANSEISQDLPALGAGFIDHVSKRYAALAVHDWNKFRSFTASRRYRGVLASPRITPTQGFFGAGCILPGYGHWEFANPDLRRFKELRGFLQNRDKSRLGGWKGRSSASLFHFGINIAEAAIYGLPRGQRPVLRSSAPYLRVDVQQPSRPDVNISWQRSNANAVSKDSCALSWHVGELENVSANLIGQKIVDSLDETTLGATVSATMKQPDFSDTFHMMGGTRMSTSQATGVVDSDLRVFGTSNTYVAGPSVFPGGGMANPTYTALALSHRLGEHLA